MKAEDLINITLKEDPDQIELPDGMILGYADSDSIAFGYADGDFYTGHNHNDMAVDNFDFDPDEGGNATELFELPGRIFENHKVISFWDDVTAADIQRVADSFKDDLGITIDDAWRIDTWMFEGFDQPVMPIKDYLSAKKRVIDKQKQKYQMQWHNLSPIEKEKYKKLGVKNAIDYWGTKDVMPMEYRYKLRGESELAKSSNNLHEQYYDTIKHPDEKDEVIEIFINPKPSEIEELLSIISTIRGFVMHNGDIFLWRGDVLHMSVMPYLGEKMGIYLGDYYKNTKYGVAIVKYPGENWFKIYALESSLSPKALQNIKNFFKKSRLKNPRLSLTTNR